MAQQQQICPTTIHLCRLRVTRLVASGAVASPPNNAYVTDSAISLDYGIDVDDGEEKQLVTGCDKNRVTYRGQDKFKRFTFGLDLSALEPALIEMMTGASLILDSSPIPVPMGFNWPLLNSAPPPVAIEGWVDNWIDDAQAATPFRYTRYIWPMTFWRPDDGTLENEFKTESMAGYSRSNALWGNGPYLDQIDAANGNAQKAIAAMGGVIFSDSIPAAVCGYKATTSGSL